MPDSFCVYPFIQVVARNNKTLGPCCMLPKESLTQQTISEFWHGSYLKNLRSSMINNYHVNDCESCYSQENKLGSSMRTEGLRDYKFSKDNRWQQLSNLRWENSPYPKRIELHVSNLCNLKCLTCNPADSSMFLAENKKLGISNVNQTDFTISNSVLNDLVEHLINNDIELLDLRGGESMLVPSIKQTLERLPEHVYNNTTLRIQTNGTVLTESWKDLLKKFQKVEIMLSIDSVGEYNTYIRYPSKWEDIQDFATWVQQQPNIHCFVACTVSNLNILSLDLLIKWCEVQGLYCHLAILTDPDIYKFTNLPESVLKTAQEKLSGFTTPKLNGVLSLAAECDDKNWNNFCKMIDTRDAHRGNRIFNVYPELKDYWV